MGRPKVTLDCATAHGKMETSTIKPATRSSREEGQDAGRGPSAKAGGLPFRMEGKRIVSICYNIGIKAENLFCDDCPGAQGASELGTPATFVP